MGTTPDAARARWGGGARRPQLALVQGDHGLEQHPQAPQRDPLGVDDEQDLAHTNVQRWGRRGAVQGARGPRYCADNLMTAPRSKCNTLMTRAAPEQLPSGDRVRVWSSRRRASGARRKQRK